MRHIQDLTHYVVHFIDGLAQSGLENVVISPGSRSTPLAMTVCEHDALKEWIVIDERSAAFFALGMAQQTKKPVALICTSGTAATNYLPAITEAYYHRVPLIVLTTDRPHELRDVGAPQAIDQIKMYSNYVKWSKEMALPSSSDALLKDVRKTAMRAVTEAMEGNEGPVHLNFPFREPLVPDYSLPGIKKYLSASFQEKDHQVLITRGRKQLSEGQLQFLNNVLKDQRKGLIVCGPQKDEALAQSLVQLAKHWNIPILADPLSQIRAGEHDHNHIITSYDAILRDKSLRGKLKPDFIIRFGAMPVSKAFLFYIEENPDILQFIVENDQGYRNPTNSLSSFIFADSKVLIHDLLKQSSMIKGEGAWLTKWKAMEEIAHRHLFSAPETEITEGEAIRGLLEVIPDQSVIYVGNSMAVRDLDTFFKPTNKNISVLANRGVNGIDGVVSSSLGAAAQGERVTLILGDLSFYHDLNGLLIAKHYDIDLTVLLINNDGGGIFSFLPQAKDGKHFEKLFGTPLNIQFHHAVHMYGGDHVIVTHEDTLKEALKSSYSKKGLSVIEVQTDRTKNAKWHQHKWDQIIKDLQQWEEEYD